MGSWLSYGLGSENKDLPAFVVLSSFGSGRKDDQPLYDRLWGSGFLPSQYQGVKFRNSGDPVLYLSNPNGMSASTRRQSLDDLKALNHQRFGAVGDPEIQARIAQYEMAFRMQTSVPELTDFSKEPQNIIDMYGPDVNRPGSFAANCLLARRLAERDVRFVQLFHMGWDQHFTIFLAGGGIKPGMTIGETDDFCYNILQDPVSIFDLHATMLNHMGIDHIRMTFKFQGLDAKLTGVENAHAVKSIML